MIIGRLESSITAVKENAISCRAQSEKNFANFNNKLDKIIEEIKEERTIQKSNTKIIWKYLYYSLGLGGVAFALHLVTLDKESLFYEIFKSLFDFIK